MTLAESVRFSKKFTAVNTKILSFIGRGYYNKFSIKDDFKLRKKSIEDVSKTCQDVLATLGINISSKGAALIKDDKPYFMVSNHMSYIDIICLSALRPSVFVTSIEMKDTPFLGDMASFGGSYFVERRDRSRVPFEVKELAELMKSGFSVFVFPEATSTNGQHLIPFKRAMFRSAILAEVDVVPVCMRYNSIDGKEFSVENHDQVCWYGKMSFFPHYTQLLQRTSIEASVEYLEPIPTSVGTDRYKLADQCYSQIKSVYFKEREGLELQSN